ncbi:unnamed protein product, partial [Adineta ricciae]
MTDSTPKQTLIKSRSSGSLRDSVVESTDIFTSTHLVDSDTEKYKYKGGRRAMLPSISTVNAAQAASTESKDTKVSHFNTLTHVATNDFQPMKKNACQSTQNDSELQQYQNTTVETEKTVNNADFDIFILSNFTPFTGKGDVVQWLAETEDKFTQFRIARCLRYQSISLLVTGDAKRIYVSHRKTIHTFDDFYEFMISTFQASSNSSCSVSSCLSANTLRVTKCDTCQSQIIPKTDTTLSHTNSSCQPDYHTDTNRPNAILHTTMVHGEVSTRDQNALSLNSSNSQVDPAINELRKAIVSNLIKNPKTFKGEKDDVKKWLEDIEHLFDIAH